MKYTTEEAFVGANAFGKGAAPSAARGACPVAVKEMAYQATDYLGYGRVLPFLTKVVLQCLPYIGYPRSLNAMDCIAKAAKQ